MTTKKLDYHAKLRKGESVSFDELRAEFKQRDRAKAKMTKPTKPTHLRSHMLQIRVSPSELRELRASAKRLSTGVSALVRSMMSAHIARARRTKAVNA